MGTDDRGRTIHGWLTNADHALLVNTVKRYDSNINRYTSFAVSLSLHDANLAELIGVASHIPAEERLGIAEIRSLVRTLREENGHLRKQLEEIYPQRAETKYVRKG